MIRGGVRSVGPSPEPTAADLHLAEARQHARTARVAEAERAFEQAIAAAEQAGQHAMLAEALRGLAVLRFRSQRRADAVALCRRSLAIARVLRHPSLAAEALNVLAGFAIESGQLEDARALFQDALREGAPAGALRGRIEQNLGVLANIQGDWEGALGHYRASLDAFAAAGDDHGRAHALHNLGMISADRQQWGDADRYFRESLALADAAADVQLRGLCLVNHAEVLIAWQRYDEARQSAEDALRIFDRLGATAFKSDAYRTLGVVYRETGVVALAEARLRSAIDLAVAAGSALNEADASRELARLYQEQGRNQDALRLLNAAHRLYGRLDARVDLVDVGARRSTLEGSYLEVVRAWGRSIESSDSYTHGHCERVADYAVAVARVLGLDDHEQTVVRLGAYLHDVGKVRVPHEILNKPGRLTPAELEVMRMHTIYGVELLAAVDFPWDIKPIIRWHHERRDGTGYPDRLRGDEIPLSAQIIGIVDVYDALTTARSYRGAMTHEGALAEMRAMAGAWREDVVAAFERTIGSGPAVVGGQLPAPGRAASERVA